MSDLSNRDVLDIRSYSSMVFQEYNLFKNKTVIENVAEYLIKVKKINKKKSFHIAEEYLKMVGLEDKAPFYPHQLSGGQQQRVGIARALAVKPDVMLLDEPTSALDPELIRSILDIIRDIAQQGQTMLIVTHEMNFAREISDKIIFLEEGKIIELDSPENILDNPKNIRIQEFLSLISI